MDTANRIRSCREKYHLSRNSFSKLLGIPLRTVEDWESGRRKPPAYIPNLIESYLSNMLQMETKE